jgi:hypothetical protein
VRRKRGFWFHFPDKMIILPRQARDKHREKHSQKRDARFLTGSAAPAAGCLRVCAWTVASRSIRTTRRISQRSEVSKLLTSPAIRFAKTSSRSRRPHAVK